jgi:hypothetical protein
MLFTVQFLFPIFYDEIYSINMNAFSSFVIFRTQIQLHIPQPYNLRLRTWLSFVNGVKASYGGWGMEKSIEDKICRLKGDLPAL